MTKFSCFTRLIKRNTSKENDKSLPTNERQKLRKTQQVKPLKNDEVYESVASNGKVISHDCSVEHCAVEKAYEGEDERDENAFRKREYSDFDPQERAEFTKEDYFDENVLNENYLNRSEKGLDVLESGHISDPGIGRAEPWVNSPKLKRSCSNLETRQTLSEIANHLPFSKSQSLEDLQNLPRRTWENFDFNLGSPASVMTHWSADRVMLKKHSSSQILPSRSRKLWWKLFLWSHRNLHKSRAPSISQPVPVSASNQQCGYSSDILEPNQALKLSKTGSPASSIDIDRENFKCNNKKKWSRFARGASSTSWPHNQWVAFSAEPSSFTRVNEWVKDLRSQDPLPAEEDDANREGGNIIFPPSPEIFRSSARNMTHPDGNISEAIIHANSIIQSLNKSSTTAHISGISLKAIPNIFIFSSLRSVNLSNNFIVRITPGSLPKGLHALNLSKNKISTIEGLRELTRLRVLDLSYNRIFRIGQGLSKCVLIKELYLAGNKISDIEGLHRLLKLAVLDLSFNKIATTKAIGQLVANYNSLLALNLLGNPIQSNIGEDQLRKAVCGLLPKLAYLNKQPIKPQRAREVLKDSVAKAALGNTLSTRRKTVKRGNLSGSASPSMHRGSAGTQQRERSRSKTRNNHHLRKTSFAHSPSH